MTSEAKAKPVRVRVARTFRNEQVEFPEGLGEPPAGRKEGHVHFARGRVTELTEEEFQWLEDRYPALHGALEVLPEPTTSNRAARRFAAAAEEEKKKPAKAKATKKTAKKPKAKPAAKTAKKDEAKDGGEPKK